MCKRKENGDDVPLGAPSPHPQNVSDIGTTDTSSTAHAISNEDLKQLVQHYHDIIAQKNEVISQQKETIQQKENTIQQQGHIISIQDTHIQRLEDDNSQLRESIHKQSATIDILTKRISELENYLESVAYNKPDLRYTVSLHQQGKERSRPHPQEHIHIDEEQPSGRGRTTRQPPKAANRGNSTVPERVHQGDARDQEQHSAQGNCLKTERSHSGNGAIYQTECQTEKGKPWTAHQHLL